MDIRIFDPPEAGAPTFRSTGRATGACAVTLVERLYEPGRFDVEIPYRARHAEQLEIGRLVLIGGAFWGVIDDLELSAGSGGERLNVSGRQLKGLALDRITIPPDFTTVSGAQGYDAVTGTTEAVMKHFVSANLAQPQQAGRGVFGLEIAPDLGRGRAQDRYMSRHEVLADVLKALGEAAGLGYDIVPDLERQRFVFDVVEGADHTAGQSARGRVVFELSRKTALSLRYRHSAADSRNVFYTTMAGAQFADEALTIAYLREGENEPSGLLRREKHLEVSANTPQAGSEYEELRRLALLEAEEFKSARSFTCELAQGPYAYRRDFRVGDLVTVRNREWGVSMDARLTAMESRYDAGGAAYSATFGDAPLNVVGRLQRQIRKGV